MSDAGHSQAVVFTPAAGLGRYGRALQALGRCGVGQAGEPPAGIFAEQKKAAAEQTGVAQCSGGIGVI